MTLDRLAHSFFVENLRTDWLTPIMESVSALATPLSLLVLLLLYCSVFAPGKRPGMFCALNLVLVVLLNVVLKELVQRPRPENISLVVETGFSFPQGILWLLWPFCLLVWLVWHYEKDRTMRYACCAGFSLIILLIGISRIYLGVHYASDVLAGFCVSLAWLALYTRIATPLFL